MAGKVINSGFVHLSTFVASRQESASNTATSHIRKPLAASVENRHDNKKQTRKQPSRRIQTNLLDDFYSVDIFAVP